jgi:hypothetical protein
VSGRFELKGDSEDHKQTRGAIEGRHLRFAHRGFASVVNTLPTNNRLVENDLVYCLCTVKLDIVDISAFLDIA